MLIYLDMCSLQRPLDDKSQLRVLMEAEAVLATFALIDTGQVSLLSSEALEYETRRNPHPVRQAHAQSVLRKASHVVPLSAAVESRARAFGSAGLHALDALHLACAVEAGADYFCTCDDRLLNRSRLVHGDPPKVVNPLELIEEIRT